MSSAINISNTINKTMTLIASAIFLVCVLFVIKSIYDKSKTDKDGNQRSVKDILKYILTLSFINDDINSKMPVVKKKNENPQVFHIDNQVFTYNNAKKLCKNTFNAEIATENNMNEAYNQGANWCSAGWIDGQSIMHPIQPDYFKSISKKQQNDCTGKGGKPGLQGGKFYNPNMKFGVNCYGKKPKVNNSKLKRLNIKQNDKTKNVKKKNIWKNKEFNVNLNVTPHYIDENGDTYWSNKDKKENINSINYSYANNTKTNEILNTYLS